MSRDSGNCAGILIIPIFIIFYIIYSSIEKYIEKKAKELSLKKIAEERNKLLKEVEEAVQQKKIEINKYINKEKENISILHAQLDDRERHLAKKEELLLNSVETQNNLFKEKTIGFPWIAEHYEKYLKQLNDSLEKYLLTKKNPSIKGAEAVRVYSKRARIAEKENLISQGIIAYYESLFPWLAEFKDAPDDIIRKTENNDERDPASHFLSTGEWSQFNRQEKFQLALERYWKRRKTNWEIGRDFERFIGYEYERKGWEVTYYGAIKGFEDLGRDIIAQKNGEIHIVQCKYWAKEKIIHEKHIFQLFGTAILYELEYRKKPKGVFITSCQLSDVAKKCASMLGIEIIENKKLQKFPSIKCNIGWSGEKIYHLPFDQQYDKVKIEINKGEFYCLTIKEAEEAGFRRAFRWRGNA